MDAKNQAIRRRAVARGFRATKDRLNTISQQDLHGAVEFDKEALTATERKAVEIICKALDKIDNNLGVLARKLES